MLKRLITILFVLLSMLSAPSSWGRRPVRLPDNGRSNSIMVLAQDAKGFIWVGTNEGLLYYDGYSYSGIIDRNSTPAVRGRIRCLLPDDEGRIWIGTEEGPVVYFPEKMEGLLLDGLSRGNAVKNILRTPAGDFAVFATNGIEIIDGKTFESHFLAGDEAHPHYFNLRQVYAGPDGDFWSGYQDKLVKFSFKDSRFEPESIVWAAGGTMKLHGIDPNGTVYFNDGAGDLRICRLPDAATLKADAASKLILRGGDTRAILFFEDYVEVTTAYGGIIDFRRNEEGEPCNPVTIWLEDNDHTNIANCIMCATRSRDGNIFYGTTGGLFIMKAAERGDFRVIPGGGGKNLLHNVVSDIYTEDGKCFWVATSGGLDELYPEYDSYRIIHHEIPAGLVGDGGAQRIQCITSNGDGLLWMGTKKGIIIFDTGSNRFSLPRVFNAGTSAHGGSFCKTLLRLPDGQLLAGFIYGGIFLYDPATDRCSQVLLGDEDIAATSVFKLSLDAEGRVWAATSNKGVYSFAPSGLKADGGELQVQVYTRYSPGAGAAVYNLYAASGSRMLACTSRGLFELPAGKSEARALTDPDVPLNFTIEDRSGNFWSSAISGLLFSNHDFSSSAFIDTGDATFSQMDYNTGGCLAADGSILIGGVSGVTCFDPLLVSNTQPGKTVYISSASVMGSGIPVPADLRFPLKWNDRQLALSLSTLTYPADLSRTYFYKEKDSGDKWIPLKGNVLSFSKMPPGKHEIALCCDNVPASGDAVTFCQVLVSPPWWRTWWAVCLFVLLALLLAASVTWVVIAYRRGRIKSLIPSFKGPEEESADERILKRIKEEVEKAIPDEDYSLDRFAERMNISKSVLTDRMRTLTGCTPMEFLRKARMQRATQLLASNAFDVSQVSYMVGFSDPRYFATCFKKEFGCTPSSYAPSKTPR